MTEEKPKRGRPSLFSRELANRICSRLSQGETLRQICKDDDMPDESTVRLWAMDNVGKTEGSADDPNAYDGFYPQYARAREVGYLCMADEMLEIADDAINDFVEVQRKGGKVVLFDKEAVMRSKLRSDVRQWLLARALPKVFGNKLDLNVNTTPKKVIDPDTLTDEQAEELYQDAVK